MADDIVNDVEANIRIVRGMCEGGNGVFHDACLAVCDEIERLRAEVVRLDGLLIRQNAVISDGSSRDDLVADLRYFWCNRFVETLNLYRIVELDGFGGDVYEEEQPIVVGLLTEWEESRRG